MTYFTWPKSFSSIFIIASACFIAQNGENFCPLKWFMVGHIFVAKKFLLCVKETTKLYIFLQKMTRDIVKCIMEVQGIAKVFIFIFAVVFLPVNFAFSVS